MRCAAAAKSLRSQESCARSRPSTPIIAVETLLSMMMDRLRGFCVSGPTPTMEKAFQRICSVATTVRTLRRCQRSKAEAGTSASAARAPSASAGASRRVARVAREKGSVTHAAAALAASIAFGPPSSESAGITDTAPRAEQARSAA
jgi:hypothetical protein